ncbi:MAG: trypsin-like serine protease [Acidobacteria bacterium]|nr:trypsin-like serine protease [Acidobacteriota bacterium]
MLRAVPFLALAVWVTSAAGGIPGTSFLLENRDGRSRAYSGVVRFGGCTGTFLKPVTGEVPPDAPAYILTAGHCIELSGTNKVIVGEATSRFVATFGYFIDTPDQQATVRSRRVAYSTMKGHDVAIVELEATHGELVRRGYRPLELETGAPQPDEAVLVTGIPSREIPSDEVFLRQAACKLDGRATLVEHTWTFHDFYRHDCADIKGGSSGSPMLSARTGKIVGVVNTSTAGNVYFGGGFDCYLNIPCELRPAGPVVSRETSYAAPTLGLERCFRPDGVFDLSLPGCPLDPGVQLAFSGTLNRTTRPYAEDPSGAPRRVTWNSTLSGAGFQEYRYKTGPETSTDCRDPRGYSAPLSLAEFARIDEPVPETPGGYYLCVLAGAGTAWQLPQHATFRHVRIDTAPPILKPRHSLEDRVQDYRLSFEFLPPELSNYLYKLGPPADTDCADLRGYLTYRRVPILIPKDQEPLRLCMAAEDEAGNRLPPVEQTLDGLQVFGEGVVSGASFRPGPLAPGSLASVFGLGFPDPSVLGVSLVDSRGTAFPIQSRVVSRGQINLLVPGGAALGPARFRVSGAGGQSGEAGVLLERASPALFSANSTGLGVAAAMVVRVRPDGSRSFEPAARCAPGCVPVPIYVAFSSDQLSLELYGTGLRGASSLRVTLNTLPVEVLSAGPAPGIEGLDQVTIRIPSTIPVRGYVAVDLEADGQPANRVWVQLK